MAGTLTDVQMAAALAEQVYRRADVDQQLQDGDIGAAIASISGTVFIKIGTMLKWGTKIWTDANFLPGLLPPNSCLRNR